MSNYLTFSLDANIVPAAVSNIRALCIHNVDVYFGHRAEPLYQLYIGTSQSQMLFVHNRITMCYFICIHVHCGFTIDRATIDP